jgi:hypothetical protein
MGRGKTFVALWLAKQFNFSLFVVCPVSVKSVWEKAGMKYGVRIVETLSYQSMRSKWGSQPSHGWLVRNDVKSEKGIKQTTFSPTPAYLNLVRQGIMVVCDEAQMLKNNSAQYKAACALFRPILTGDTAGRSRYAALSGTPFDKEEHATNLVKLLGYVRSPRMYYIDPITRQMSLEGMEELLEACRFIDAATTDTILVELPPSKDTMKKLAFELFVRVISQRILGGMPVSATDNHNLDVKNGYYRITGPRADELTQAVGELAEAVRFNGSEAQIKQESMGSITTALVKIEAAKIPDIARVAARTLEDNPTAKVVIAVNYTDSLIALSHLLALYNPLILNGSVKEQQRAFIAEQFRSDPAYRLFLMNMEAGGLGISLHDTVGDSPRYMFLSPNYKMILIDQAVHRVHRDEYRSQATVRVFYGAHASESGILNALARKTGVVRKVVQDDEERRVLPGDYEIDLEQ